MENGQRSGYNLHDFDFFMPTLFFIIAITTYNLMGPGAKQSIDSQRPNLTFCTHIDQPNGNPLDKVEHFDIFSLM